MSTATKDRRSPVDELMEGVPFTDLEDTPSNLAPETPLTSEAVIHLRAAGREVSRAYGKVQALLATVERALAEPSGGSTTLSEEERMDLAMLLREARQTADHKMQRPIFERGRGERPHGGVAGDSAAGETVDATEQHARGVFEPEFTGPRGERMLFLVDGGGRYIGGVMVPPTANFKAVLSAYRHLLGVLDPEGRGERPAGSPDAEGPAGANLPDELAERAKAWRERLAEVRKTVGAHVRDIGYFDEYLPEPPFWWYPIQDMAQELEADLDRIAAGDDVRGDLGVMYARAGTLYGLHTVMGAVFEGEASALSETADEIMGFIHDVARELGEA